MKRYEDLAATAEKLLRGKYSYLCIRGGEFEEAMEVLRGGVGAVSDDESFDALLHASLKHIPDGHLRIISPFSSGPAYRKSVERNYLREAVLRYMTEAEMAGPFITGDIGGIQYVSAESLHDRYGREFSKIFERECPQKEAFIIDLRGNGGGNDSIMGPIASSLYGPGQPRVSQYYRERLRAHDPSFLGPFMSQCLMPDDDSFLRRVAVLIGPYTYSSAESTAMDFAAIPGAVVIGDVSGGGSARPRRYLLDGGSPGKCTGHSDALGDATFALDIPSWLKYRPDKVLLEGNGIVPHIRIPTHETFVDGRDLVLEKAIEVLK